MNDENGKEKLRGKFLLKNWNFHSCVKLFFSSGGIKLAGLWVNCKLAVGKMADVKGGQTNRFEEIKYRNYEFKDRLGKNNGGNKQSTVRNNRSSPLSGEMDSVGLLKFLNELHLTPRS